MPDAPTVSVQPGSPQMPSWTVGELPDAPAWSWKNWTLLIGPGLLSAGAAIGGGEWLMGPVNTGRFGGAVLWVCTLSILAQVLYNIEISRYTLYSGEPIMNGKFRTFLGPMFWLGIYIVLDLGSLMPYQTASTATPVYAVFAGRLPKMDDKAILLFIMCALYILAAVPLVVSGKIYSFVKGIMTLKVVVVFSTLLILSLMYSSAATWLDIGSGFFKFGTLPVKTGGVDNIFTSLFAGRGFPDVDTGAFAALAAFAAIAGIGGLKNTMISSYTREQGWGMGGQVGAIPSMFGGRKLELSHAGKVFAVTPESLPRWRRWVRHVAREQLAVWMTGAIVGVGLPAMLSVQFLTRGAKGDPWAMAAMTAEGVQKTVGGGLGQFYWYLLMICGILVLVPNTVTDADSTVRRWVDLAWTGSKRLQKWEPRRINLFYFWVLVGYVAIGVLILLFLPAPKGLVEIYGCIANFALGYSCLHVLAVNLTLLPRELRPCWFNRIGLVLSATYFFTLSILTLRLQMGKGSIPTWVGIGFFCLMAVLLLILAGYAASLVRRPEKAVAG